MTRRLKTHDPIRRVPVYMPSAKKPAVSAQSPLSGGIPPAFDLSEEPLTPAEVLTRFKISFRSEKQAKSKIYELTRRRGNRPPMPSHRVGKELRFYWSEIRQWQQNCQQLKAAA